MSVFTLLEQVTEKKIELPKNTLKNTLIVSHSILHAGTVNLNKVKNSVPHVRGAGLASAHADYKLLTRYFDQGKVVSDQGHQQYEQLMQGLRTLCWMVLFQQRKRFGVNKLKHLLLDGTKWDFGQESIHLMTLCVLVGDVAIPIWWEDLGKAGHSSQEERIAMLSEAMKKYGLAGMTLLADREYVGREWFKYLSESGLYFVIRVKEGIYHDEINANGGRTWQQLKAKAAQKAKGKKVSKKIKIDGLDLHYIVMKNPRPDAEDELVYLLTNLNSPTQASRLYEWRWQVEVCFKHLKSNGVNLEAMNVEGKEKRHLMMAIAVLAYILAIREGLLKEYRDGIRWVLDKRSGFEYRAVSVFLKGLDILRRKALNLIQFTRYLRKITKGEYELIFQNV
ncbi:MAG: transposase [Lewinellaceae bacterium]|nr:transposase [Lewinellaceae bacterium]